MKATLIIPDGYKRVTRGFARKDDLSFSPTDMTWKRVGKKDRDAVGVYYFLIRKTVSHFKFVEYTIYDTRNCIKCHFYSNNRGCSRLMTLDGCEPSTRSDKKSGYYVRVKQ